MRTEKMYDPKQDFYALKSFKYSGRDYKRGDAFPSRDISNKNLLKFFQNGFVGYSSDFKYNKTSMKEVEQVPEKEEQEEEEVNKPKRKRRQKNSTE